MKKIYFTLSLLFHNILILHAEQINVDLDCSAAEGPVVAMVFDSPKGFRGLKAPIVEQVVDCKEGFLLPALDRENFVVVVYFDQNQNGKLDRNFMGIPSEPIGFSAGYEPKGPPQYAKALVQATTLGGQPISIKVSPGLGPRGRIGVGALVLYRSSIYIGERSGEFRVLPGLSYIGKRIQVLGPNATIGLWNTEYVRTAIAGSFRGGAYDENDRLKLKGLGDRKDTFMTGLSMHADLSEHWELSAQIQGDALNRIGGGVGEGSLSYGLAFKTFSLVPYLGFTWLSSEIAQHDYGLETYQTGAVISPEVGLRVMKSWGTSWVGLLNTSVQRLDDSIYDSPIVDERFQVSGFASISYQF